MITVTSAAAQEIKNLLQEKKKYLRIAVKGGGCSGFSYQLDFVEEVNDMDYVIESNGVTVVVDPKSSLYLNGVTLVYEDGLMGSGFSVNNPNARTTCGCGESFSV